MIEETTDEIKRKANESDADKLQQEVVQTKQITLKAIDKESQLEKLLEKEEEEREIEEQKELEEQVEAEKKKDECLAKSIKEKELEEQFNISKMKAEEQVEKLKDEARKKILIQRQEIKDKISEMRKRAERKKRALKDQIMTIRTKTAGKLQKYTKAGDANKCFLPKPDGSDKPTVEKYCNENFADNYIKNTECMQRDNFCYVCCENEFGEYHLLDREKCEKRCYLSSITSAQQCSSGQSAGTGSGNTSAPVGAMSGNEKLTNIIENGTKK
jgi:hypothetical protein